jgi:hypothetical protein
MKMVKIFLIGDKSTTKNAIKDPQKVGFLELTVVRRSHPFRSQCATHVPHRQRLEGPLGTAVEYSSPCGGASNADDSSRGGSSLHPFLPLGLRPRATR